MPDAIELANLTTLANPTASTVSVVLPDSVNDWLRVTSDHNITVIFNVPICGSMVLL